MSTKLGSMSVGSTVKLKLGGTARDFLVVHQGLPSSMYDSSCNGTWLLLKDIYTTRTWDSLEQRLQELRHPFLSERNFPKPVR